MQLGLRCYFEVVVDDLRTEPKHQQHVISISLQGQDCEVFLYIDNGPEPVAFIESKNDGDIKLDMSVGVDDIFGSGIYFSLNG